MVSNEIGNALFDEKGTVMVPFKSWSIYNADPNHLVIIDVESGTILKYIERQTGYIVSGP